MIMVIHNLNIHNKTSFGYRLIEIINLNNKTKTTACDMIYEYKYTKAITM